MKQPWNVFKYSQQLIQTNSEKKDFPEDHIWFKVHPTAYEWNTWRVVLFLGDLCNVQGKGVFELILG